MNKLTDTNYMVKLGGRRKGVKIYHVNLMKPYVERQAVVCLSLNSYEEMPIECPPGFGELDRSEAVNKHLKKMVSHTNLTGDQIQNLENLIEEFKGLFSDRPARTNEIVHDIATGNIMDLI